MSSPRPVPPPPSAPCTLLCPVPLAAPAWGCPQPRCPHPGVQGGVGAPRWEVGARGGGLFFFLGGYLLQRIKAALAGSRHSPGTGQAAQCIHGAFSLRGWWGIAGSQGVPSTGSPLAAPYISPYPVLSPSCSPHPLLRQLLQAPSQQRGLIKGSLDLGAPAPRHPPCLSLGKIKWEGVGEGSPDAWVPCVRLGGGGGAAGCWPSWLQGMVPQILLSNSSAAAWGHWML